MLVTLTYGDPDPAVRDRIATSLRATLSNYGATLYADNFTGFGQWADEQTKTIYVEHSGVIVADVPDTLAANTYETLRTHVALIARTHNQDAIGFITSDDTNTLVSYDTRHLSHR